MPLFADVILPLAIPNLFTYRIPVQFEQDVIAGKRVVVQFGKQKIYSVIVKHVHDQAPANYEAKEILQVLDERPVVNAKQFELWEWISFYYMAYIGEVMNCALPSALKLQSETKIFLNEEAELELADLNDREYLLVEALQLKKVLTPVEAANVIHLKSAHAVLKSLIEKGLIYLEEEVGEKYKPRSERFLVLSDALKDEQALKTVFEQLEKKSPQQLKALMAFMQLSFDKGGKREVLRSDLTKQKDISPTAIPALIKKEILTEIIRKGDELLDKETKEQRLSDLNELQQQSLKEIKESFLKQDVVLLHGITGSGKTELYIHLIEETIQQRKQVLYLLPEIALTTQIINRLRKNFGNSVGVYHSKFNSNERVEVWNKLAPPPPKGGIGIEHNSERTPLWGEGGLQIILGARSSVFLPFSNLGLVIVDEEHENSYKQFDPAPRYHARDTAIVLARIHGAKTLLGSATPSYESYFNAQENKYGFVSLTERHGGATLPWIVVADVAEEKRKKLMKSHFSHTLIDTIKQSLDKKEQVILFQNRRGFASYLECKACAWTPHCINCDVTLTYHKKNNLLRCHYCGFSQQPPGACSNCGDQHLEMKGFGTERIEEDLAIFFPETVIARMDTDSTRSKHAYQTIITDFEQQRINILVGTQMVTKGLDFDHVSLVGILNADQMLNFPDFRAHERSFQLMSQVSGRAGRKEKPGKVIIQTHQPTHWVIEQVLKNDFKEMFRMEMIERKKFSYPPYFRLIEVTLKHKNEQFLNEVMQKFSKSLRLHLGKRVIGPQPPLISRIKNLYLQSVMIKIEREASVAKAKEILRDEIFKFRADYANRAVLLHVDVDPV